MLPQQPDGLLRAGEHPEPGWEVHQGRLWGHDRLGCHDRLGSHDRLTCGSPSLLNSWSLMIKQMVKV